MDSQSIDRAKAKNSAVRIAAKSFFKELKNQGFNSNEIINLSGELIGMVSHELRNKGLAK